MLRLRDQALRGEVWVGKLLQKFVEASPERGSEYDFIEMRTIAAKFDLIMRERAREPALMISSAPDAGT